MILPTVKAAQKELSDPSQPRKQLTYGTYTGYDSQTLNFHLLYPFNWTTIKSPLGFSTYPQNKSLCYPNVVFTIVSLPKPRSPLEQFVSNQVNDLKKSNFAIIDSSNTTVDGNQAQTIISVANGTDHMKAFHDKCAADKLVSHKLMDIYAIIDNKAFIFRYDASSIDYSYYFAAVKHIIQSITFKEIKNVNNRFQAGLTIHVPPSDMAVNPLDGKLYVSSDKVYVMNGTTGNELDNIIIM